MYYILQWQGIRNSVCQLLRARISSFMDNDSGVKVEYMFAECDSPSLIEIYSSCDLKVRLFYYLIGGKTGHLYLEIIQVFDFIIYIK